jgi:hypothetical protein
MTTWAKSSYSTDANNNCVECSLSVATVAIRDSKDPHGPVLRFPPAAWENFLRALASGELSR